MQVTNIANTSFLAGKAHSLQTAGKFVQKNNNLTSSAQESLYENINGFIENKYNKAVYLEKFTELMKKSKDFSKFSSLEQDYIRTVMMTLDTVDNINDISDGYLKWLMKNLLTKKG